MPTIQKLNSMARRFRDLMGTLAALLLTIALPPLLGAAIGGQTAMLCSYPLVFCLACVPLYLVVEFSRREPTWGQILEHGINMTAIFLLLGLACLLLGRGDIAGSWACFWIALLLLFGCRELYWLYIGPLVIELDET